jgi:hypothetical protein
MTPSGHPFLQLVWLRWRSAFLRNWAELTALLVVGVSTLSAFAFNLWLGPWNLLRLFGY